MADLKNKKMIVRSGIGGTKEVIEPLIRYKVTDGEVPLDVAKRFIKSLGDQE